MNGCPPRPENMIRGVMEIQKLVEQESLIDRKEKIAAFYEQLEKMDYETDYRPADQILR